MNTIEPLAKLSFCPISALCSKFYPRNISYMPAVKFFTCLGVCAYLIFNKNSTFARGSIQLNFDIVLKSIRFCLIFIRKLSPLTVDTRSDDLQLFVVAQAFWSSHARLSVNRH